MYQFIKEFYDDGLYTDAEIAEFTAAGWITPEEYETITGNPYQA